MEWIIILLVLVLLFGAKKLPETAKALGQSLRLFKKETNKLHDEDAEAPAPQAATATTQPAAAPRQPLPSATPSVEERLRALEEENARLRSAQARAGEPTINGVPLSQAQKDQGSR